MAKITAKTLIPFLLQALKEKTAQRMLKGEDFNSIFIRCDDDFIDYVCSLGKIDPLALGDNRKEGINRQIIYAERTMRSKGMCRKGKRGYYALANPPTGLDKVTVEDGEIKVKDPTPTQEPQAKPQVPKSVPQTVVQKNELLYDRPETFPSVGIFGDTHFRNIAISQTKCFGRWSGDKRAACSSCPLAQFCFEKQNLDLQSFALRYMEQLEANQSQPKQDGKPKQNKPKQAKTTAKSKSKLKVLTPEQMRTVRSVKAQLEASCKHCGKAIEIGSDTIWVPGDGTYHKECVEGV